jgi:hypothetical protein
LSTGDNLPVVDAGSNYAIPINTPFMLTANASDIDDDEINYTWEEMDLGTASNSLRQMSTDNGNRPLFRSFWGSTNPTRFFPQFDDVIDNFYAEGTGETLPVTNRTLNFRVTTRSGSYGLDSDSLQLTSYKSAGPFSVTQPLKNSYHLSAAQTTVSWNVANTNQTPVSCSQVDIFLATDGGVNFASFSKLLSNTANDGSAQITLPSEPTESARILVKCSNNIFYNVNEGDFIILPESSSLFSISTNTSQLSEGNSGTREFTFTIARSGSNASAGSVNYAIAGSGSSPANSQDFYQPQNMSGVINFTEGESSKFLSVFILGIPPLKIMSNFQLR